MNETEKDRIAAATNALRPDWPTASVRTLLDRPKLTNRARRDVACALAWVACETESKVPARILENGPWWTAWRDETMTRFPPKRDDECRRHPGQYRDACNACAVDRYGDDRGRDGDDGQPAAHPDGLALARAGIETGKRAQAERDAAAARAAIRHTQTTHTAHEGETPPTDSRCEAGDESEEKTHG